MESEEFNDAFKGGEKRRKMGNSRVFNSKKFICRNFQGTFCRALLHKGKKRYDLTNILLFAPDAKLVDILYCWL